MTANEEKKLSPGVDLEKGIISFDYIKGNDFRVIHVDGIWGGNAPQLGTIHMDVFSERWPIPKRTASKISPEGGIGEEIFEERITRNAVVREVEAHLVMNIEVATVIRDWLTDKIENYQKVVAEKQILEAKGKD
jgi:hypothetical protein